MTSERCRVNFSKQAMQDAKRIALINPTKFLGNLLLAGGLIQQLGDWCVRHDKQLLIVLDEGFEELFSGAFPAAQYVFYPRKALLPGLPIWAALRVWLKCIRQIRAFNADVAFNIEEDSVSHRLTHFSGARWKVSSTTHRYHFGFNEVMDVVRNHRPASEQSIWYSFADVISSLGVPVLGVPAYVHLHLDRHDTERMSRFQRLGLSARHPLLLMHAGASKSYKQWPAAHFSDVAHRAIQSGYQVVLIGAGARDQQVNLQIGTEVRRRFQLLNGDEVADCIDLCNQLSLLDLASLMLISHQILGNDSGPSHLASALGLSGVVIFGPTDLAIWRPLGEQTAVMDSKSSCEASCTRHHCRLNYRCLSDITPQRVIEQMNLAEESTKGKPL